MKKPGETINIKLPAAFTAGHEQAVRKYFVGVERLTEVDWQSLTEAMDLLRQAEIVAAGRREHFSAVYDRLVDAVYANRAIASLDASWATCALPACGKPMYQTRNG